MLWALRSAIDGIRDEFRGWRDFKSASGAWPVWSILTGVFSIPILFALGVYFLVAALHTRRLSLIYGVLFSAVTFGGILWYVLRRAASMADVARAKRTTEAPSQVQLENFLR